MFGSRAWNPYGALFFDADDQSGGGGDKPEGDKPADPLGALTPEQRKAIDGQIAAARRQAEADAKRKHDEAAAKAKADADAEAERKRLEASGEYEAARKAVEAERDTHKATAETLKAENDAYAAIAAAALADREKALADLGNKELSDAYPKDASALERWKWFESPLAKVAIAAATAKADATQASYVQAANANRNPKPNGDPTKTNDDAARREQARSYRDW